MMRICYTLSRNLEKQGMFPKAIHLEHGGAMIET